MQCVRGCGKGVAREGCIGVPHLPQLPNVGTVRIPPPFNRPAPAPPPPPPLVWGMVMK